MIPEEYVTLPTAKLLRDAGFPKDGCSDNYQEPTGRRRNGPFGREDIYDYIPKPTQAQAMRWLREKRENFISVYPLTNAKFNGEYIAEHIILSDGFPWTYDFYRGKSYEEAAEAGIQAACKYLIELQKTPNQ